MGIAVHSKVLYEPVIWKQLGTIKTFLHYSVVFIHSLQCSVSIISEKADFTTNRFFFHMFFMD